MVSENPNYGRESLFEMWRQNIAGRCQQTYENKKIVDNTQQCFALPIIWIFTENESDGIESRLASRIYFIKKKIVKLFKNK